MASGSSTNAFAVSIGIRTPSARWIEMPPRMFWPAPATCVYDGPYVATPLVPSSSATAVWRKSFGAAAAHWDTVTGFTSGDEKSSASSTVRSVTATIAIVASFTRSYRRLAPVHSTAGEGCCGYGTALTAGEPLRGGARGGRGRRQGARRPAGAGGRATAASGRS